MNLKKLSILLSATVLTVLMTATAQAQNAGTTGGTITAPKAAAHARRPILEALSKLNLTADQKSKVEALVKARSENVKAFRQAHKGDRVANRENAKAAQKTFMDGLKGVLTPDQMKQLQEMMHHKGKKAAPPVKP